MGTVVLDITMSPSFCAETQCGMFPWTYCTWTLFGVWDTTVCLLDTSTVPQGDTAILLSCLFSIYIKRGGQWIEIFCHKVFLSSQISIPLNYWRSLSGENAGEPKSWKGLDGGVKFYKLTCSFEIITDLMTPSVKEVVSYNSSRTA